MLYADDLARENDIMQRKGRVNMDKYIALFVTAAPTIILVVDKIVSCLNQKGINNVKIKTAVLEKVYPDKKEAYTALINEVAKYLLSKDYNSDNVHDVAYDAMIFMDRHLIDETEKMMVHINQESSYRKPGAEPKSFDSQYKERVKNLSAIGDQRKKIIKLMAKDLNKITNF